MDGRRTIIGTLKWYFGASDDDVLYFDEICDLLLLHFCDESDKNPPESEDMEAEIEALARIFRSNEQSYHGVKDDLLELLKNWWDTVTWARQDMRLSTEKEEFIADLVAPIKDYMMSGPNGKPYYNSNVLEALLQMSKPPYGVTRHVRARLPRNVDLRVASNYYRQLNEDYGFRDEYPALLELLSIKMARNAKRHLFFLFKDYKVHFGIATKWASYDHYISYRGLIISPELSNHCKRLFHEELKRNNNAFSSQTF